MEKIGDFSKRCEVTIKALRWYDKLGLLVPDYIDKFTGYRYYSIEKVAEMRRITELKDIGFLLKKSSSSAPPKKTATNIKLSGRNGRSLKNLRRTHHVN